MTRIAILYGTTEGQTAHISEHIAEEVRDHGHGAQTLDIKGPPDGFALDGYEAVMVGASIHTGKHEGYVRDFAKRNGDTLERLSSAFFSVSMAAHDNMDEAGGYNEEFERETGGNQTWSATSGGAAIHAVRDRKAPPHEEDL